MRMESVRSCWWHNFGSQLQMKVITILLRGKVEYFGFQILVARAYIQSVSSTSVIILFPFL
ncbi:hypothetical protein BC827DRAFT_1219588 [Russula dissimulans]|nr:hypothetical protein BC827DRAFT_1219588 [Russula dissimulans]